MLSADLKLEAEKYRKRRRDAEMRDRESLKFQNQKKDDTSTKEPHRKGTICLIGFRKPSLSDLYELQSDCRRLAPPALT
jgi:hypothetical protein